MRLEILVGMIGSGKSTYARKRADEGALVVCHDDIMEMLHARYRYEPELLEVYRMLEESLVLQITDNTDRDIVIDRTNLTRESRSRWVDFKHDLLKPSDCIVAVSFAIEAAEVHAKRRWLSDPRGGTLEEWTKVAERHHAQAMAEPLDASAEGFDALIFPTGDAP